MPAIEDPEGDNWQMTVDFNQASKFISLVDGKLYIEDLSDESVVIGDYKINFTLEDLNANKSSYTIKLKV